MPKNHYSKNSTNRRNIIPELMLAVGLCLIHKQNMKRTIAQQERTFAKYQAKKQRYTHNQTAMPVFQASTSTNTVVVTQQLPVNPQSSSKCKQSSFRNVYERALAKHNSKLLTASPKDSKEQYYATRGIM